MPDFYIVAVRNDEHDNIDSVKIRLRLKPITGESSLEATRVVKRSFIYDLLRTKKLKICTAVQKSDGKFYRGDEVVIYGDEFITTSGNRTTRDNLDSLPTF